MAEINIPEEKALAEVKNLLEAELSLNLSRLPDIPALHEELAILVSTGKAEEAISVPLTQEQVKRLEPKDVEKYYKRYETYVGAKTTETLVGSFVSFSTRTVAAFVSKTWKPCRIGSKRITLIYHERAVKPCRKSCVEMWAAASCSQHGPDHTTC